VRAQVKIKSPVLQFRFAFGHEMEGDGENKKDIHTILSSKALSDA
jgi:hypothetical protein